VINVGAEIHVSGLDPSIDERQLLNIFNTFGPLMAPPRVYPHSVLTTDLPRRKRTKQRLCNSLLHRFRSLRRCHRIHERSIPRRSSHHPLLLI
jgi:hypothetical protein